MRAYAIWICNALWKIMRNYSLYQESESTSSVSHASSTTELYAEIIFLIIFFEVLRLLRLLMTTNFASFPLTILYITKRAVSEGKNALKYCIASTLDTRFGSDAIVLLCYYYYYTIHMTIALDRFRLLVQNTRMAGVVSIGSVENAYCCYRSKNTALQLFAWDFFVGVICWSLWAGPWAEPMTTRTRSCVHFFVCTLSSSSSSSSLSSTTTCYFWHSTAIMSFGWYNWSDVKLSALFSLSLSLCACVFRITITVHEEEDAEKKSIWQLWNRKSQRMEENSRHLYQLWSLSLAVYFFPFSQAHRFLSHRVLYFS